MLCDQLGPDLFHKKVQIEISSQFISIFLYQWSFMIVLLRIIKNDVNIYAVKGLIVLTVTLLVMIYFVYLYILVIEVM